MADIHSQYYRSFILGGDLRQALGPEAARADTLHLLLNKGIAFSLLTNNLVHSVELQRLGLRPDTALACLLHYLLRLKSRTLWQVPRPLLALMTDEDVIKIGIKIRFGDDVIEQGSEAVVDDALFDAKVEPFFRCAQELEADILARRGAARVVYFIMSDSHVVLGKMMERHGQDAAGRPKLFFFDAAVQHFERTSDKSNRQLVVEQWLLSQSHFFIISRFSGLGRSAAMMSLRQGHIFTMTMEGNQTTSRYEAEFSNDPTCALNNYDRLENVAGEWSGF